MKKKKLSSLGLFNFLDGSVKTTELHPDLFYTIFNAGLSVAVVNSSYAGTPDTMGVILHTQRIGKGNTSASNTMYQLFLSNSGLYRRQRSNTTSPVEFSPWVKIG